MNKYLSDYFQIVQNQLEFPVNLNLLVPINSGQDWALKEDRAPTSTLCENNATLWFSCSLKCPDQKRAVSFSSNSFDAFNCGINILGRAATVAFLWGKHCLWEVETGDSPVTRVGMFSEKCITNLKLRAFEKKSNQSVPVNL